MSDRSPEPLARSREELGAARLLLDGGFPTQAMSRAYYATFHAGEHALQRAGQTRKTQAGVISAFGKHVILEGGFDRSEGRILASLFGRRNEADYQGTAVPVDVAEKAIAEAESFVGAVEAWIAARRDGGAT